MSKLKKNLLKAAIALGIVALISGGVFAAKIAVHGKFPPGTTISGIDISYKTPEEAKGILEEAKEKYLSSELEISLSGQTRTLTPKDLGINILVEETIQIINETDATKISIFNWPAFTKKEPTNINILTKVDHETLIKEVDKAFDLEKLKPQSATFYFDESGTLSIKEEKAGLALDEEQLINELKESAKELEPLSLKIELKKEAPKITKEKLETRKPELEEELWHEFVLLDPIYSDDWYLKLKDHLDWVVFEEEENLDFKSLISTENTKDPQIKIKIAQDQLNKFIDEEISKWLDKPPEPVNIFTNEDGSVTIEGKGNDGLQVQRALLKKSIELALENRIRDIPIPVLNIEPEVNISEDLQELGIVERIGVGHSSFYHSTANRVHNIVTASAKQNATLVAPDEIFSFNNNLGPVDSSTGYKKELVIKAEGTIPEYGGGVCQVSTTMYRAALLTGLPIVERNEHSYVVSYYSQVMGDGLDATIYLGGADLRFLNDTGHHILIQAYTENEYELYFVIYGTDDGRKVELEGPYLSNYHNPGPTIYQETDSLPAGQTKQVEKSHTGFNALWYRYITDAEGVETKEEILTRYRAIPAKILVGTGGAE